MTGDLQPIAEGREAEVFIRGDGLVVKLMSDATDPAAPTERSTLSAQSPT